MRAEKRKKYIPILLTALLVLSVPLVWVRTLFAVDGLNVQDYADVPKLKSEITCANGDLIYKATCLDPELFGNLVGIPNRSKIGNGIANSITRHYADYLVPHKFNILRGIEGMIDKEPDQIQTTLMSVDAHQAVADAFDSHDGICAVYNYVTGEVYMLLSLPSGTSSEETAPAGSMKNFCLAQASVVPASTMKLIATLCALDQDIDPNMTYTCTGSLTLPDGNVVNCHNRSGHGKLNLEGAIGLSCNTYIAYMVQKLNVPATQDLLHQLGFFLNGEHDTSDRTGSIGRMAYCYSRTTFENTREFNSVWGLVGQGETVVNPVHMLTIIGAIANGGQAANPYLVEKISSANDKVYFQADAPEMLTLMDSQLAQETAEHWSNATEKYYNMDERFTMLKTGTAQINNGKSNNRLLMGVIEEQNTVFYISVTNTSDTEIYDIANTILSFLPTEDAA